MQLKNDELQSKIASALANNSSSSTNNYDFKQKLIETKNFAKVNFLIYSFLLLSIVDGTLYIHYK